MATRSPSSTAIPHQLPFAETRETSSNQGTNRSHWLDSSGEELLLALLDPCLTLEEAWLQARMQQACSERGIRGKTCQNETPKPSSSRVADPALSLGESIAVTRTHDF